MRLGGVVVVFLDIWKMGALITSNSELATNGQAEFYVTFTEREREGKP